MTLREKRVLFTRCLAHLIAFASDLDGYEVAVGEVMDRLTPRDPTSDHMKGSLHDVGLAADIDLYIKGVYQTSTHAHTVLGVYWEGLHQLCRWGGRFTRPDGNHYSIEHEGRQ